MNNNSARCVHVFILKTYLRWYFHDSINSIKTKARFAHEHYQVEVEFEIALN